MMQTWSARRNPSFPRKDGDDGFRFALPILVIAQSDIVGAFREEWPTEAATTAGRWRSDRTHPEQFVADP